MGKQGVVKRVVSGNIRGVPLKKAPCYKKAPPCSILITPPEAENFCKYKCIINSAGGENCYKKAPSYKKAPPLLFPNLEQGGGLS